MPRINQRYADRLNRLANYIDSIPEVQYNHAMLIERLGKEPCGTVACAFGHAIASQKFPGLKCKVTRRRTSYSGNSRINYKYKFGPIGSDRYASAKDWAEYYFGPGTWDNIFDTNPYLQYDNNAIIRRHVIKNLRKVAAQFQKQA